MQNRLLLLLLLLVAGRVWAADARFEDGIAAYEAGQYPTAAEAFGDSLAGRIAAGTLVNLGLAEWQMGRAGEAVLAWEQAAWLDPFRSDARCNLAFARETTGVNPPDLAWFETASTWLPANWWTWIAGGSLWLAVGLVTVPGFLRMRKAGWPQTTAAVALGIFLLSLAPCTGVITRSRIGILVDKNTALRLTPTHAAEIITALPAGEPVRRLRTRGDYFLVRTENGNGWIERRQVRFVCPQ
jgi:hypothetical protein